MNYSITFVGTNDTRNTWDDWQLIPSTPPMISPPDPQTNMVDIPGRRLGPIDLSLFPFSKLTFKRITGTWEFYRETDDPWGDEPLPMRVPMYEEIRNYIHGRTMAIRLEEDASHFYRGRFVVSTPRNSVGPTSIQIGYDLEPMRYNRIDGSPDTSWVDETGEGGSSLSIERARGHYF